ncbi:MAG: hypothetical protein JNK82_45205, partial [Myxococcaceae bacterium]|nr:hypothetical protein [Myxococcaceae bacterium]
MRPVLAAAVLAATGCATVRPECGIHGGTPWLEVRSEHFVMHTNLDEPDALRMSAELELGLAALHRAMRQGVPKTPAPVEAVVLRNVDQLQGAIGQSNVVGYWRPDWRGPLIVMGGQSTLTASDRDLATLKHELTHFVSAYHLGRQPRWVAEGLGRYFQTLGVDVEKRLVRSGELERDALAQVQWQGLLPLEKLWRWGPPGSLPPELESAAYASSWLWVHFLFNRHKGPLKQFFDRLRAREEPRAAFEAVFPNPKLLYEEAKRYLDLGDYRVTVAPLGEVATGATVKPFSNSDVHGLL